MREILFRGKRRNTGEWVEGDLLQYSTMTVIQVKEQVGNLTRIEAFPVDPETVGEFTGLLDMNGKKIFEGDILECWPGLDDHCRGYVKYGEWNCPCCYGVYGWVMEWPGDLREPDTSMVIGNIWDNKELLGGETQEGPDR